MRTGIAVLCLGLVACGQKAPPVPERKDGGTARNDDARPAAIELAAQPLGLPEPASFDWRKRDGHAAFRAARKAERRGDWEAVVEACREALAADPGHLDAAWLLAIAQAKLGRLEQVVGPLQLAVSGEPIKWSQASLDHPALQPFLSTPRGQAWRRRIDQDRATFLAMLARAVIVSAGGDLFAYDPEQTRWHRLTRSYGAVLASLAVPSSRMIAYVTRSKTPGKRQLAIGVVDLGRPATTRPVDVGTDGPVFVSFSKATPQGFWIGTGTPRPTTKTRWRRLDADDATLIALPVKSSRPSGPWLEITGTVAQRHGLPLPAVSADWDDHGLASALRIGSSNRVVSVPSPGLIDGNTLAWSPDRSHLAFVADLDDECRAGIVGTAVYVADATTGSATLVHSAPVDPAKVDDGLALQWINDRSIAVADRDGVVLIDLTTSAPTRLPGATGLATPRYRARCSVEQREPVIDASEDDVGDAAPVGDAGVDVHR
ncbi:MAG: hypothetical protein AB7P03_13400 [Kofleriaceae bacterium]